MDGRARWRSASTRRRSRLVHCRGRAPRRCCTPRVGPAPVVVGALGQAGGAEGVAAVHATGDHPLDQFKSAQALAGGFGIGQVHRQALYELRRPPLFQRLFR